MVKFLIYRPIAVIMTFVALSVLGIVSWYQLPVSLMPDIDVPLITVNIDYQGTSAEALEEQVVKDLRLQLQQVGRLDDIKSETRAGKAFIELQFKYGTNIDLAFIEVNEKIDLAAGRFPREMNRPVVTKASASDIPVFYLSIGLKDTNKVGFENRFLELSSFVSSVVKKQIEQLPEIAMADISGAVFADIVIIPDEIKTSSLGIDAAFFRQLLDDNNIETNSFIVKDGHYQYNISFSNNLKTIFDIKNIWFNHEGRMLQLKEIAGVKKVIHPPRGYILNNKKPAISIAVIKQADARMEALKKSLNEVVGYLKETYPEIVFDISRDQTRLLEHSIANLKGSLSFGAGLAFLIMFFFLKDFRSPILIGISIPLSLIICLLFFNIIGISINIISLSGLILGIGMMIDNAIIVIDNISQYREGEAATSTGCITGTNEVIRPLISSALTTVAVFLPLIFLSGISGTLFYEQAVTVAIGLGVSLILSVTLLPTLYNLFYPEQQLKQARKSPFKINYESLYDYGYRWVFRNRRTIFVLFLLTIPITVLLLFFVKREKLPNLTQQEINLHINWNEPLIPEENKTRILHLLQYYEPYIQSSNSHIGGQEYLLTSKFDLAAHESSLYLTVGDEVCISDLQTNITNKYGNLYPKAEIRFSKPENILQTLFAEKNPPLAAYLAIEKEEKSKLNQQIKTIETNFSNIKNATLLNKQKTVEQINLKIDIEKINLYNIDYYTLLNTLKDVFVDKKTTTLNSFQNRTDIIIRTSNKDQQNDLHKIFVKNRNGVDIALYSLIKETLTKVPEKIFGGRTGRYIPFLFEVEAEQENFLKQKIGELLNNQKERFKDIRFSGSLENNRKLLQELLFVLAISMTLLFFIMAAQFESLWQPLIVLLELPIDMAGALFLLWITGNSVNLMSMIGIVVMAGIIINDSILKVDTINKLRQSGLPLEQAIKQGGHRRLRPIIMTSATTILALFPFLTGNDMGSELQRPLAFSIIGGLSIGTLVSLYFIPLAYYSITNFKFRPQ